MMTPEQRRELIEYINDPMLDDFDKERKILQIALATLQDLDNGFVLVPSEPTDEMMKAVMVHRFEWGKKVIYDKETRLDDTGSIKKAIAARPASALDAVLKGEK